MANKTESNRIFYFDLLRVIAIIGIVFCHTSISFVIPDMGSINFYFSSFYDCFREFSVPIFVMLSGALLIGKKDSLISFFKKRLSRIFIPFIFWCAIYILYATFYMKRELNFINAFEIFIGKGGTIGVAFWFIWMIIVVYIAVFLINKHLNLKYDKNKIMNALAVLSVIYIVMFQLNIFTDQYYSQLILYYASFISYAIIGYCLANSNYLESKFSPNKLIAVTFCLSAVLYGYYIICYVVPTSISNNGFRFLGYFNVLILAMSVCIFLFFKYLSKTQFMNNLEKNKYGNAITTLSRYAYGIYLAHYLILFHMKNVINSIVPLSSLNSIIAIPVMAISVVIICFAILYVLNRIPYINKIAGVK